MADETKHPAPWRAISDGGGIKDAKGEWVAIACVDVDDVDEVERRIVACVNACAGIPTLALESGALATALDLFVDTAFQMACGCGHPYCNRCADERENAAALRALGRLP